MHFAAQAGAQLAIGADPAGHDQLPVAGGLDRPKRLDAKDIDDGLLHAARDVRPPLLIEGQRLRRQRHRRLKSREAELESWPVEHRARQRTRAGAALFSELGKLRTSRIGQTQKLGTFIKGLPSRIVAGLAQQPVVAQGSGFDQHRVPARHQQGQVRKARRGGLEQRRQQVPFQVMDAQGGQSPPMGERARQRGTAQ